MAEATNMNTLPPDGNLRHKQRNACWDACGNPALITISNWGLITLSRIRFLQIICTSTSLCWLKKELIFFSLKLIRQRRMSNSKCLKTYDMNLFHIERHWNTKQVNSYKQHIAHFIIMISFFLGWNMCHNKCHIHSTRGSTDTVGLWLKIIWNLNNPQITNKLTTGVQWELCWTMLST